MAWLSSSFLHCKPCSLFCQLAFPQKLVSFWAEETLFHVPVCLADWGSFFSSVQLNTLTKSFSCESMAPSLDASCCALSKWPLVPNCSFVYDQCKSCKLQADSTTAPFSLGPAIAFSSDQVWKFLHKAFSCIWCQWICSVTAPNMSHIGDEHWKNGGVTCGAGWMSDPVLESWTVLQAEFPALEMKLEKQRFHATQSCGSHSRSAANSPPSSCWHKKPLSHNQCHNSQQKQWSSLLLAMVMMQSQLFAVHVVGWLFNVWFCLIDSLFGHLFVSVLVHTTKWVNNQTVTS